MVDPQRDETSNAGRQQHTPAAPLWVKILLLGLLALLLIGVLVMIGALAFPFGGLPGMDRR